EIKSDRFSFLPRLAVVAGFDARGRISHYDVVAGRSTSCDASRVRRVQAVQQVIQNWRQGFAPEFRLQYHRPLRREPAVAGATGAAQVPAGDCCVLVPRGIGPPCAAGGAQLPPGVCAERAPRVCPGCERAAARLGSYHDAGSRCSARLPGVGDGCPHPARSGTTRRPASGWWGHAQVFAGQSGFRDAVLPRVQSVPLAGCYGGRGALRFSRRRAPVLPCCCSAVRVCVSVLGHCSAANRKTFVLRLRFLVRTIVTGQQFFRLLRQDCLR
ncbi:unnamed protein product, partial [Amoebophrya sp. A120]